MDERPRAEYKLEARFTVAAPNVDVADVAWNPGGGQVVVLAAMVRRVYVFRIPDGIWVCIHRSPEADSLRTNVTHALQERKLLE